MAGPEARAEVPTPSEAPPLSPDLDEARRLFHEAVDADRALDPARALALYQRALAIASSPQILFNIASCEERLGRLQAAAKTYRAAEADAATLHNEEVAREARARLTHLDAVTPRLRLVLPADVEGIDVRLDDVTLRITTAATLVDPGSHRLVARSADGRVFELTFHVNEREERTIEVRFATERPATPAMRPVTEAPSPPSPPGPSYVPAIVGGAVTVVLGVLAGSTFAVGRSKKNRYQDLNAGPTPGTEDERRKLKDDGEALYVASTVFGVSAGVVGAATITLLVRAVIGKTRRSSSALWIAPVATGFRLGGSF